MVAIANELGASAKLPGSGGAVVGVVDVAGMCRAGRVPSLLPDEIDARILHASETLKRAYEAEGYVYTRLVFHSS